MPACVRACPQQARQGGVGGRGRCVRGPVKQRWHGERRCRIRQLFFLGGGGPTPRGGESDAARVWIKEAGRMNPLVWLGIST